MAWWSAPLALLLRAGVAGVKAEAAPAIALLEQAIAQLDANQIALYAAAARRRLGQVRGGPDGAALVGEAEADGGARRAWRGCWCPASAGSLTAAAAADARASCWSAARSPGSISSR